MPINGNQDAFFGEPAASDRALTPFDSSKPAVGLLEGYMCACSGKRKTVSYILDTLAVGAVCVIAILFQKMKKRRIVSFD